ncbi:MAG: hypothetical protein FJX62_05090 [Alphaproteobacteria bacterium]|nr:hypothetical protein [Alphaproteobacteria bacterium]
MTERSARAWLVDARDFAQEAHNLTAGLNRDQFEAQRQIQLAVFFCLAAVGEALNQVPKDVQALAPDIP